MKNTIWSLTAFLIAALFMSCDLLTPQPKNPIFTGTTFIERCTPNGTVSNSLPDFRWNSPGSAVIYEVVAVFNSHITISAEKQITSTNACIAMWTSGMSGSAGFVNLISFKKVLNGVLQSASADSSTLGVSGTTNYWAVWAYNKDLEINYSSGENLAIVP